MKSSKPYLYLCRKERWAYSLFSSIGFLGPSLGNKVSSTSFWLYLSYRFHCSIARDYKLSNDEKTTIQKCHPKSGIINLVLQIILTSLAMESVSPILMPCKIPFTHL
jgi:hypothetical protein